MLSTNVNMLNSESSLHTMLFGTLMMWRDTRAMQPIPEPFPDAKVLLSYGLYKSYCDLNNLDCPIDHLAFISSEDWIIVLEGLLQNQTWGFTDDPDDNGSHWPGYDSVITLGVNVIDSLSGDDITLAERCQLQYQLARTFIDFDGIAELGYAMEQRVFGGVVTSLHFTGQYPLATHHRSWPLLSQAAGDSHLGGKLSRGEVDPGEPEMGHVKPFSHIQETQIAPKIQVTDFPVLQWYQPTRQIWLNSLWANVHIWEAVSEFGREFRKGNEIRCGQISDRLVNSIPWSTDADTYKAALVPSSVEWIVHSIGLLMSTYSRVYVPTNSASTTVVAATPIRGTPIAQDVIKICTVLQLHPSARAPMLPPIDIMPECTNKLKSCPASELFDPINTGDQPIFDFDHIDIINVLRNAIRVVLETNIRVSKPWLLEILRVSDRLEEQRNELRRTDPDFHHGLWASDWDFKIPDYEPHQLAIWDTAEMKLV
ncbi:hypothetical protein CHU98_g5556 [Xylaria longipes]|nr:hypothetical protein CHU98_g5556 [Xylaria longipes]